MPRSDYFFTSESVSEGHPDKICDQISDAVVDAYIEAEPESRVGVETLTTTNRIVLAGEVRGPKEVLTKLEEIARSTVKKIGYEQSGFHWKNADVEVYVHNQSVDIAQGVDAIGNKDEGAGDQGLMFGYACKETSELMPAPIYYSHKILRLLAEARHSGEITGIKPDSKSQLTLQYKNGVPIEASSIVLSTQHDEGLSQEEIRSIVEPYVIKALPDGWMCNENNFFVNPTGKFVIGGPDGDAGLTGRKIIVDTYGGAAPHGGGAFSGKDPTKVDRSAAYAARYLAKNIVAANFADKCSIQLSYAIGVSHPLSVYVDTYGTGSIPDFQIEEVIKKVMDLSPRGIRQHLQLNKPIYEKTASYGHFGREPEGDGSFSWEKLDLVEELKSNLS